MFGLTRDFMQQDGIYMMLGEPDGLPASKLNMVQARMLMNTNIPHHLRLLLREIDMKITLEYAVSRKKMLSHLLKSEKLSMNSFFGLLLQIARGIEDGRLYMLRVEQYALHEDYIFIEGSLQSGKVYLTYVPLQGNDPVSQPGDSFRSLIMGLMASITELTGGGVQRLLKYCGEEEFTAAGLKILLTELLTEGESSKIHPSAGEESHPLMPPLLEKEASEKELLRNVKARDRWANDTSSTLRTTLDRDQGRTQVDQQQPAQKSSTYPSLRMKQDLVPLNTTEDLKVTNTQSSSARTYVILGCLLGDALIWKFIYLNSPRPLWLAVCGGLTLVLVVLSWMVWNGKLKLGRSEDVESEIMDVESADTRKKLNRRELEWDFGRNPVSSVRPVAPSKPDEQDPEALWQTRFMIVDERGESRRPVKEPVPVAATTLLSREKVLEKEQLNTNINRAFPYLKRCDEAETEGSETIELNHASFIIGRSSEVAQYVERSEGTSRVHAEISRSSGGYVLKDLDSRNGTVFQGEPMIPYKEYPLTEGAEFKIVKGSYTFHTV